MRLSDDEDSSARDEFSVTAVLPIRSQDGTNALIMLGSFEFLMMIRILYDGEDDTEEARERWGRDLVRGLNA